MSSLLPPLLLDEYLDCTLLQLVSIILNENIGVSSVLYLLSHHTVKRNLTVKVSGQQKPRLEGVYVSGPYETAENISDKYCVEYAINLTPLNINLPTILPNSICQL